MGLLKVFVSGPYTKPDPENNVLKAIEVADTLIEIGAIPYVPHLYHFWHQHKPHPYEYWMELDAKWLRICDAVFRMSGESEGADQEVELAVSLGLPIFTDLGMLAKWLRAWR